jgi:hypothetical protein
MTEEQKFPFGRTEEEHNAFCDSMKCRRGNYCNPFMGLCRECEAEKQRMLKEQTKLSEHTTEGNKK